MSHIRIGRWISVLDGNAQIAVLAAIVAVLLMSCQRDELLPDMPDSVPPLPPAGVLVESAHDGYSFIGWLRNTEHDLEKYIVYRAVSVTGPFSITDTSLRNFWIDASCAYDTTYFYYVCAVDRSGNRSDPSDTVSALSRNINDPEPAAYLHANGENNGASRRIRLVWPLPRDFDVTLYRIYRAENSVPIPDAAFLRDSVEGTMYEDTAVAVGITYYYRLVTVDKGGRTSIPSEYASDLVTAQPPLLAPADRAILDAYPVFEWRAVAGAAEYEIRVSESPAAAPVWTTRVRYTGADTLRIVYDGPSLYQARAYHWTVATATSIGGTVNAVSSPRIFQLF